MNWGMINWQMSLEPYPDTYNGQPLRYAALVSQKNHISLYLTGIYMDEEARAEFKAAYQATIKRYDAGKSYVRFREPEDLTSGLIGETIARYVVEQFTASYEQSRRR